MGKLKFVGNPDSKLAVELPEETVTLDSENPRISIAGGTKYAVAAHGDVAYLTAYVGQRRLGFAIQGSHHAAMLTLRREQRPAPKLGA